MKQPDTKARHVSPAVVEFATEQELCNLRVQLALAQGVAADARAQFVAADAERYALRAENMRLVAALGEMRDAGQSAAQCLQSEVHFSSTPKYVHAIVDQLRAALAAVKVPS